MAAFQSELWNRCLTATLQQRLGESPLWTVPLATSDGCFFKTLATAEMDELGSLALPLPSARLHLPPGPLLDLYERVIGEYGLALRELRVKYPRDSFFSKGERSAIVQPSQLRMDQSGSDELNAGRQRVTLQFVLPRGSYATILVKRLTLLG